MKGGNTTSNSIRRGKAIAMIIAASKMVDASTMTMPWPRVVPRRRMLPSSGGGSSAVAASPSSSSSLHASPPAPTLVVE